MKLALKPFLSLFACLTLIGLSFAGCGGTGSPAPTANTNTEDMTLRVGTITNDVPFFPFYIALQKNFFKAQGLTINPNPPPAMGSGSKLATALEADSFDIAVGTISDAFTISKVDPHVKVIGTLTNNFLLSLAVSKSFEQQTHLTAASPLAEKVKALVGKKVGISAPNSSTDAMITYLFKQQGLDSQKDIVKVSIGASAPTVIATLKAGRVDGAIFGITGVTTAQLQGIADPFISPVSGDVPGMQGQLFSILYSKQSVIDVKPKAVQAFIRALAQADTFIQKNPDQIMPLLQQYVQLDQQTSQILWATTRASMPETPVVSQQAYNTANQFQVKAGLIAAPIAYNDLVATDTISKALSGMQK